MASGTPGILQRDLNTLFESGSLTGLTDRDLVERVSGPPDAKAEAAFEALVTRHGPMVLRVCRNVLGHLEDAEDAFQATFLVLVKQRGSIRKLDSVASWLYGVAARVAARARVDAARRRKSEQGGIRLVAVSATTTDTDDDDDLDQAVHGPIVQEEVRRLPQKYRSVVLLCYWEGLTQEQAAHQLGCPIGTIHSRIARARDLLRRRLVRRGLSATSGAVAVFSTSSAPAALPLASLPLNLVRSSVQAAMCVAAGQTTAGVVPASVLLLVRRALWSLAMIKMTKLGAISMVTILLAFGARSWAQRPHREDRQPVRTVTEKSKASATPRDQFVDVIEPPDLVLVEVLEGLPGRPISGERLVRPDGKISLGFYGDVYVAGLTPLEVKEKVILHLRKYLNDDALGLVETDPNTGNPKVDETGKVVTIDPKDSNRVFVNVTAYNSRNYYIEGVSWSPGDCRSQARIVFSMSSTSLVGHYPRRTSPRSS
jgi:RNA polymerase sigma factor (sigma-70 family)